MSCASLRMLGERMYPLQHTRGTPAKVYAIGLIGT